MWSNTGREGLGKFPSIPEARQNTRNMMMTSRHDLKRGGACSPCIYPPHPEVVGGAAAPSVGEGAALVEGVAARVGGLVVFMGGAEEEGVDETRHLVNICKRIR